MARGKKKKGGKKRSAFARFMRGQRRGCPTPAQIRKSWRFYKKWKAVHQKENLGKRLSAKQKRALEKAAVAAAYKSSLGGGSYESKKEMPSFFPSWAVGDPGRRKKKGKGKKGKKGKKDKKGKRGKRLPKGFLAWRRFAKKHGIRPFKKKSAKQAKAWNKWKKRKYKGKIPMRDFWRRRFR